MFQEMSGTNIRRDAEKSDFRTRNCWRSFHKSSQQSISSVLRLRTYLSCLRLRTRTTATTHTLNVRSSQDVRDMPHQSYFPSLYASSAPIETSRFRPYSLYAIVNCSEETKRLR